mmetsp:Transcript_61088/g.132680  ORF Transcript_61088/g.132680 Transcript_61088/m.132680 type:complete len:164 (+) Transcript_61088:339-830(+)
MRRLWPHPRKHVGSSSWTARTSPACMVVTPFFSVRGLQIVMDYWRDRGLQPVAFLPRYIGDTRIDDRRNDRLHRADDPALLWQLIEAGDIVVTPSGDYDDSYALKYAVQHNACVISNDRYNDYIMKVKRQIMERTRWVKRHVISFAFAGDEFIPNPDFQFPDT